MWGRENSTKNGRNLMTRMISFCLGHGNMSHFASWFLHWAATSMDTVGLDLRYTTKRWVGLLQEWGRLLSLASLQGFFVRKFRCDTVSRMKGVSWCCAMGHRDGVPVAQASLPQGGRMPGATKDTFNVCQIIFWAWEIHGAIWQVEGAHVAPSAQWWPGAIFVAAVANQ